MILGWTMLAARWFVGLALGLFCITSSASAILIETGASRVGGFLVEDDGATLKIRVRTPDGQEKVLDYARAKVKIIHQLDVKRLEKLSRDNPRAYRDYAEELAGQEADPEARYVARRLYLLAAHLDPQQFGSSSLLSMSAMAAAPAESRKFRAMAFLLDPKADPKLLKGDDVAPPPLTKVQLGALHDFIKALQNYRAGEIKLASDAAKRESLDKIFTMAPGNIDQQTFLGWCNDAHCPTCKGEGKVICPACKGKGTILGNFGQVERCLTCKGLKTSTCQACDGTRVQRPFPDEVMRLVLRAELWALDQLAGGDAGVRKAPEAKNWSAVLQSRRLSPILPLSLETITEFDPRKCHYRNGVWVAP
jgi:hypothetical protein